MPNLLEQQKELELNFSDFDLGKAWNSCFLIESIRRNLGRFMPKGLYDPQDLEHQILFRLTTYDPHDITDRLIEEVVEEQYLLIRNTLDNSGADLEHLFRGMSGRYVDLNCFQRLELKRDKENGGLIATDGRCSIKVKFRKIENGDIIELFAEKLHYVHQARSAGDAFGFFFEGDEFPWALETAEPSTTIKQYKRDALLAHGINPDKAMELTRFYTLPGSPRNAISMIDSKVSKYYKPLGIEALITATMPAYAKTKSSTIAGGLNNVLLIKDLKHRFIGRMIDRRKCYQCVTRTYLKENPNKDTIESHPNFPLLPTVEVFMAINKPALEPIEGVRDKTIYVKNRNRN